MKSRFSLLIVLALVCPSCVLLKRGSGPDLTRLPELISGAKVSQVETFRGEELYNYMNGAAATYLEYGPVEMTAADVELAGVSSKVEVYALATPAAAAKVYAAFAKSEGGEDLAAGEAGRLWPSTEPEAILHQGPHFVRVMTYAADAATGKRIVSQITGGVGRLLAD